MRFTLALVTALLVPSLVGAQATDDDLARAHFESGSAYYEQGRYDDAAREFTESYRLSPRAVLLENAARAQERGLHFDEAIATLQELLRSHPDYPQAATIRERIVSYERLRDRLSSQGGDESGGGADGSDPGPDPEPDTSATSTDTSGSGSGDGGGGGGGGGGVSIPGIILLAAGGALGLTSIITGAVSQSIYDDLDGMCSGVCPASLQGDVDTGEALALTSTILMFPSIIALGVGVVLLIIDSGGGDDERASVEVVPGPGEGGVAVRGWF